MFTRRFAALLALSATASSLAFDGPQPTPIAHVSKTTDNSNEWTPKPTSDPHHSPSNLSRRNTDNALCGYVQGLKAYPISCPHGPCQHDTTQNWFGCCSPTDNNTDNTTNNNNNNNNNNCNTATRCIPSASLAPCLADPTCATDPHILRCSEPSAAFCVQLTTVLVGAPATTTMSTTLSHYVCAAAETVLAVRGEATASGDADGKGSLGVGEEGARSTVGSRSRGGGGGGVDVGATAGSVLSTAGAAVETAKAVVGVAGGLVGLVAMLF